MGSCPFFWPFKGLFLVIPVPGQKGWKYLPLQSQAFLQRSFFEWKSLPFPSPHSVRIFLFFWSLNQPLGHPNIQHCIRGNDSRFQGWSISTTCFFPSAAGTQTQPQSQAVTRSRLCWARAGDQHSLYKQTPLKAAALAKEITDNISNFHLVCLTKLHSWNNPTAEEPSDPALKGFCPRLRLVFPIFATKIKICSRGSKTVYL